MNDMPRNDEPAEDRSIQVPSKTPKRSMNASPRATIPRVQRSGNSAPTAGEASGIKYDLRKPRPSDSIECDRSDRRLATAVSTLCDTL